MQHKVCDRCGVATKIFSKFTVNLKDSNEPEIELDIQEHYITLCNVCRVKMQKELDSHTIKFKGISEVEKGAQWMLKGLENEYGLDLHDENFTDTPKRIARAYAEIFEGVKNTEQQVQDILSTAFPCDYDQLILVKEIEVFSMCPHHFLPVQYKIHAAYIPEKGGRVLGISKLSRLVDLLAKRPVLQEQLVEDVTKYLMQLEGTSGAACIAEGVHYCMVMRGVKQHHAVTVTSSMKGTFMEDTAARAELMTLIK